MSSTLSKFAAPALYRTTLFCRHSLRKHSAPALQREWGGRGGRVGVYNCVSVCVEVCS